MRTVLRSRLAIVVTLLLASPIALADNDDQGNRISVVPEVSVGSTGDCGEFAKGVTYPAGSNIVTSAWLRGMGLPDNGGLNTTPMDLFTNPNKKDPHTGLLMSKNGPTLDCSSAEARIEGWKKGAAITELGFDYRNGGHCGAGAPRFNVTTKDGQTFFLGCAYGVHTPAPQDPLQWTRVRFSAAACAPTTRPPNPNPCQLPTVPSPLFDKATRVERIDIVYDEGTDTSSPDDPNGVGLAVLDNIDVNGVLITTGRGVCPSAGGKDASCPTATGKGDENDRGRGDD